MTDSTVPMLAPVQQPQADDPLGAIVQSVAGVDEPQQPQQGDDPVAGILNQMADQQDASFLSSMREAVRHDPSMYAAARKVGDQLGVDPLRSERNLDFYKKVARERSIEQMNLSATAPNLYGRIRDDLDFARVAHNEIERFGWLERGIRQWNKGQLETERSLAAFEASKGGPDAEQWLNWFRSLDYQVGQIPEPIGWAAATAEVLGQAKKIVVESLEYGFGAAAGASPAAMAGPAGAVPVLAIGGVGALARGIQLSYETLAGEIYADLLVQAPQLEADAKALGVPWDREKFFKDAWLASRLGGAANAAVEALGGKIAAGAAGLTFKPLLRRWTGEMAGALVKETTGKAVGRAALGYMMTMGGEVLTESVEQVVNIAATDWATRGSRPGTTSAEAWEQIKEVAGKTAKAMALLAIPGPGLRLAFDRQRIKQAERERSFWAAIEQGVSPEILANAPDAAASFVAAQVQGQPSETTYVNAEQLRKTFAQRDEELGRPGATLAELEAKIPGLTERLSAATTEGDSVAIPTSDFATNILLDKNLGPAIKPHVKLRADGFTIAEAEQMAVEGKKMQEAIADDADKRAEGEDAFRQSSERVASGVSAQLQGYGFSPNQADASAAAYSAIVRQRARREGVTPEEWHRTKGMGLDKQPAPVDGKQTLGQPEQPKGLLRRAGEALGLVRPTETVGQPGTAGRKATFDPVRMRTTLHEKADVSSFIHESAHFYLTVLSQAADAQSQKDMQVLLDWFGVKDAETWNAMSVDQQRRYHEQFAYSFESYVAEGKAPSIGLQGVFDRFAAWLRDIYKNVVVALSARYKAETGVDLPAMSPEVRGVMDRMLASEDEIAMAEAVNNEVPAYGERKDFKGTDEEWAAWVESREEQRLAAEAELTTESLKAAGWVAEATEKEKGKLARKERKERAELAVSAQAEVAKVRVYRLREWLKTGRFVGDDGKPQGEADAKHRIRTSDVVEVLGEDSELRGVTAKDGLPADLVAEQFGYTAGSEMIRDLSTAVPFKDAVRSVVDDQMAEQFPELTDPEARQAAIDRAIHNEARRRFLAVQLRHLEKSKLPTRLAQAAAKEQARRRLSGMTLADVQPHRFVLQEAKASREVLKAIKAGDATAAAQWTRRQMLNSEMARQASDIRDEAEVAKRKMAKFAQPDDKITKSRNIDYVNAGRAILSTYPGLVDSARITNPADHLLPLKAYDLPTYERLLPYVANNVASTDADYRNLSVAQFRDLADQMELLWDQARREELIELDGKLVRRAEVIEELSATLPAVQERGIVTDAERNASKWTDYRNSLQRVQFLMLKLDGGKPGVWTRTFWRPMDSAFQAYVARKNEMYGKLRAEFSKLEMSEAKIPAPELGDGVVLNGTKDLLGVLLHLGNPNNRRLLLLGYGWATESNGVLEDGRFRQFIDRLHRDKVLRKEHWDFAQGVWDLNESMKAEAQKINRHVYGTYFKEIPAQPVETPWGTLRGGYMPAKREGLRSDRVAQQTADALSDMEATMGELMGAIGTGRGFTIERTGSVGKLSLDASMAMSHIGEVLRFVHMQPVIKDLVSLLRNRKFYEQFQQAVPGVVDGVLFPWLERTSKDRVVLSSGSELQDAIFSAVRASAGFGFMFGNVRVALQQVTGLSNALEYVKGSSLSRAFWQVLQSGGEVQAMMVAKSQKMANIVADENAMQHASDIRDTLNPTRLGSLKQWQNKHGYVLQRTMQNQVNKVVWLGAYRQKLDEVGATMEADAADREAVRWADEVVTLSQGGAQSIDVARFEVGTPAWRLFTQFSTYFNTVLNQITTAKPGAERAVAVLRAMVIPSLVAASIGAALSGGAEFDDEDKVKNGVADEVAWWLFSTQVKGAAGMVPVFGNLVASVATSERRPGDRITPAPFWSALQSADRLVGHIGALADGKEPGIRAYRDAAQVLAMFGLPATPAVIGQLAQWVDPR